MPEKLLNLKELASYLKISEEEIKRLVEGKVIPAYKIGGAYLRFRKEQIDAIKEEIPLKAHSQVIPTYKIKLDLVKKEARIESSQTVGDKILDFVYFSDFYIISFLLIAFMLFIILKM